MVRTRSTWRPSPGSRCGRSAISRALRAFFNHAGDRAILTQGVKVAAVVGTVLNLINQGDRLLALRFADVVWWKVALTYLVPFGVSVFSAARSRMFR